MDFFDIFIFNNVKFDHKITFCQPNKADSDVKSLPLYRLYPYRKPRWAEVGQTYIHIRRNCTLWFWQCKNLAVRTKVVKNKATGTPHEVYYIQPSLASDDFVIRCQESSYICTQAWGFRRCSFRQLGRCQSLYTVERVTGLAPRFYVYIPTIC